MANIPVNPLAKYVRNPASATGSFAGISVLTDSATLDMKDANGSLLSSLTLPYGYYPMFITSASVSVGEIFLYP